MVQQPWELPLGVPMVRCSKRLHLGYTMKGTHGCRGWSNVGIAYRLCTRWAEHAVLALLTGHDSK